MLAELSWHLFQSGLETNSHSISIATDFQSKTLFSQKWVSKHGDRNGCCHHSPSNSTLFIARTIPKNIHNLKQGSGGGDEEDDEISHIYT